MFSNTNKRADTSYLNRLFSGEAASSLAAIKESMPVVEFDTDGHVLDASEGFLAIFGYRLDDLLGQHHRLLCTKETASAPSYELFWQQLRFGQPIKDRFLRVARNGEEVWLEACYSPIRNSAGRVVGVLKIATDITDTVLSENERERASAFA